MSMLQRQYRKLYPGERKQLEELVQRESLFLKYKWHIIIGLAIVVLICAASFIDTNWYEDLDAIIALFIGAFLFIVFLVFVIIINWMAKTMSKKLPLLQKDLQEGRTEILTAPIEIKGDDDGYSYIVVDGNEYEIAFLKWIKLKKGDLVELTISPHARELFGFKKV